jgi:N-acetyl sugar amidotransferase
MILELKREYQICNRCVMDTTDPEIKFDESGNCNHCTDSINMLHKVYFIEPETKKDNLNRIVDQIKKEGKNKTHDCIIGLSGGVDSSFLAYVAVKELKLRPLAVHLDNGWNSELAVKNIENIVNKLGIDLYTHVIDWSEFKDLQLAFLRASVLDIELLTDHAIGEAIYRLSKKFRLKYFLSGFNCQSETIMPAGWLYQYKMDSLNIKDIYNKNGGTRKLKTFKFINFYQYLTFGKNRMNLIPLLNNIDYQREKAIATLERELDWRNYGNKHDESVFTKFYQGYILPKKFNIDKRRAHLSSLICSDQITREKALKELELPVMNEVELNLNYFFKKLDLRKDEFEQILRMPPRDHWDYRSFAKRKQFLGSIYRKVIK